MQYYIVYDGWDIVKNPDGSQYRDTFLKVIEEVEGKADEFSYGPLIWEEPDAGAIAQANTANGDVIQIFPVV